jgi:hypothetical protein
MCDAYDSFLDKTSPKCGAHILNWLLIHFIEYSIHVMQTPSGSGAIGTSDVFMPPPPPATPRNSTTLCKVLSSQHFGFEILISHQDDQ